MLWGHIDLQEWLRIWQGIIDFKDEKLLIYIICVSLYSTVYESALIMPGKSVEMPNETGSSSHFSVLQRKPAHIWESRLQAFRPGNGWLQPRLGEQHRQENPLAVVPARTGKDQHFQTS